MRSLKIASLIGLAASGFGMSISNHGASNQHTSPTFLRSPRQETKSKPNKVSQAKRRKYKRQGR